MRPAEQQLQQGESLGREIKGFAALIEFVLNVLAVVWGLVGVKFGTRGTRSFGLDTLAWLCLYPVFGVGLPADQKRVFDAVWYAALALLVLHRLATVRAVRAGTPVHRRDVGVPRFGSATGSMLAGLALGGALALACPPAGLAVGLSAAAWAIQISLIEQRMQVRLDQMSDAVIEQETLLALRRQR